MLVLPPGTTLYSMHVMLPLVPLSRFDAAIK